MRQFAAQYIYFDINPDGSTMMDKQGRNIPIVSLRDEGKELLCNSNVI